MARQVSITVSSANNRVIVMEADGANIISHYETGLGAWAISSGYGSLTGSGDLIKLKSLAGETGEFKFSEISDIEVDGVDVMATASDLRDVVNAIAPTMFAGGDAANPLPSGAATAAKQDTGNTSLSSIDTKLSSQSTAANQTALNGYIGADETGTTLRGRLKAFYDAFVALVTSGKINSRVSETDALIGALSSPASGSVNAQLAALTAIGTPIDVTITPLTTQGATIDQAIGGRKMGAFQWIFTKNAGTDGEGTLYGSIDGTRFESLGTTGSQTADATGIIRFDENWKTLKFEFTTQTGAGSTFGGTFYAS